MAKYKVRLEKIAYTDVYVEAANPMDAADRAEWDDSIAFYDSGEVTDVTYISGAEEPVPPCPIKSILVRAPTPEEYAEMQKEKVFYFS